jgi:hypothetical protein
VKSGSQERHSYNVVAGRCDGVAFQFVICCAGYLNGKVLAVKASKICLSPDATDLVSDGSLFAEPDLNYVLQAAY